MPLSLPPFASRATCAASAFAPLDATPDLAREREALFDDFGSANIEREAWSALYYRFLAGLGWSAAEVAEIARPGYSDAGRHLRRRLQRGYRVLAELIGERERAAAEQAEAADLAREPVFGGSEGEHEVAGADGAAAGAKADTGGLNNRAPAEALPPGAQALLSRIRSHSRGRLFVGIRSDFGPEELEAIAAHSAGSLVTYRLARFASCLLAQPCLDGDMVGQELEVALPETEGPSVAAEMERHVSLNALMVARSEPVLVILGPPGGGKSTHLRLRERDLALAGLWRDTRRIPVYFQLAHYPPGELEPRAWMSRRWQDRYPALPALNDLLAEGRVDLLLDGLNELPYLISFPSLRETTGSLACARKPPSPSSQYWDAGILVL